MADIWEYIANFNPQGFYEDNRAKMLSNDINTARLDAINRENSLEKTVLDLKKRVANGDKSALKPLGVYSPETTKKFIENEQEMLEIARPYAQAILRMAPENREKGYQQMLKSLPNIDTSDMPDYYDENVINILANSDPQKLRDDRLNEQAIDRMNIQHGLNEQANENQLSRDIRKLEYGYNRADQKVAEAIAEINSLPDDKFPQEYKQAAIAKLRGADISPVSDDAVLAQRFITGQMTPEEEQNYLARRRALTLATSTKTTSRTPAQEFKDMYGAGFTPESIVDYSKSGDINDLKARPIQGGSVAADVQKYNMYNQEKDRMETNLGRPLNEEEDLGLQSKLGITSQEMKNAEYVVKHGFTMEEIGARNQGRLDNTVLQGSNALNLENVKQRNRVDMADINQANAEKLENLRQQNRTALRFIDDEISKGKELRDMNNKKSLAEFKKSLPTEKMIELANVANYLKQNGLDVSAEELLAKEYQKGLEAKQVENDYKQAQIEKINAEKAKTEAEIPFAGQTQLQQNAQWLVDTGAANDIKDAVSLLNSKTKRLGEKGDVVNGVTLTGYPAYDEALLKKKAEQDVEDEKNQQFIQKQAVKLKPVLQAAYKAAQDGSGIGLIDGYLSKKVWATPTAAKNISAVTTLMNMVGPTMIAQLKAAGAGARSFDSEGERQTYLPDFSIYQDAKALAEQIKQFADKMLDIQL